MPHLNRRNSDIQLTEEPQHLTRPVDLLEERVLLDKGCGTDGIFSRDAVEKAQIDPQQYKSKQKTEQVAMPNTIHDK